MDVRHFGFKKFLYCMLHTVGYKPKFESLL